jgi:hypothetical protein
VSTDKIICTHSQTISFELTLFILVTVLQIIFTKFGEQKYNVVTVSVPLLETVQ